MVVRTLTGVNGDNYTARYFGTGDSSRVLFNLAGMDSDRAYLMPVLFKQDWGGIQQLYSTPRVNLALESQTLGTLPWVGTNATGANATGVAPDGTNTGCTITVTAASHSFLQLITVVPGAVYDFSFWAKLGSLTDIKYSIYDNTNGAWVNLFVDYSAQVGAGWARVHFPFTAPALCTSIGVYPLHGATGTGTMDCWGVKVWYTYSSYFPTTTAPVTVTDYSVDTTGKVTTSPALPLNTIISYRDPHAPSGNIYRAFGMGDGTSTDFSLPFVPKVPVLYRNDWQGNQLLYSTARTNLLRYSDQFGISNAIWEHDGSVTVTSNYAVAPDGTMTADRLQSTAGAGSYIFQDVAYTGIATHTESFYLSSATPQTLGLALQVIGGATPPGLKTINVDSTWRRFEVSVTPGAGTTFLRATILTIGGVNFDIKIWGAQLEIGSTATSYIPTTTAAVTVTDYTYTPNGDVTMAVAPLGESTPGAGDAAILTGDFNMGPTP